MPKEIQITHGLKEGELVSIADVERGLKCNCTCTKCGEPLVAKKGEVKDHHFAHSADSDCSGETIKHIMAKQEIAGKKYLHIPHPAKDVYGMTEDVYSMTDFKTVELEKRIGDSQYIADVICTTANDKQLVIEIVVTHDLDNDKRNYLRANEITTLRIDVNNWDYQTQRLNEYMLQGNNNWVYNKKAELAEERIRIEAEKYSIKIEAERKRREKEIEEDLAEQERKWKEENKALIKEQNRLDKAFKEIWSNTKKDELNRGKLIYGNLVVEDLREYGNNYPSTLCVKSHSLSKQYNNLAMVHEYHQKIFRPYIGQKVGIKIIYEFEISAISNLFESERYFPKCIIFWMDGKTKEELRDIRDVNGLRFIKDMDFRLLSSQV